VFTFVRGRHKLSALMRFRLALAIGGVLRRNWLVARLLVAEITLDAKKLI
jgi:hypothetical protein